MTPDQQARAEAWATVFDDSSATAAVFDDITVFVNALPETQMAGAMRLFAWMLLKRSAVRRERRQVEKGRAKTS